MGIKTILFYIKKLFSFVGMSKCLFCETDVAQKDGKRARLFCNGNCRNKYYYQKEAANKPKKKVGRPKKDAALNVFSEQEVKEVLALADKYVPKKENVWFTHPPQEAHKIEVQAQIDDLEKKLSTIAEGIYGTPMRNKIQDKIAKLKRQLKDGV